MNIVPVLKISGSTILMLFDFQIVQYMLCIYRVRLYYWKSLQKFMFVWTRITGKKLTDSFLNRFIPSLARCVKCTNETKNWKS